MWEQHELDGHFLNRHWHGMIISDGKNYMVLKWDISWFSHYSMDQHLEIRKTLSFLIYQPFPSLLPTDCMYYDQFTSLSFYNTLRDEPFSKPTLWSTSRVQNRPLWPSGSRGVYTEQLPAKSWLWMSKTRVTTPPILPALCLLPHFSGMLPHRRSAAEGGRCQRKRTVDTARYCPVCRVCRHLCHAGAKASFLDCNCRPRIYDARSGWSILGNVDEQRSYWLIVLNRWCEDPRWLRHDSATWHIGILDR